MRWIADDPSPDDRAELQRVLAGAMAGSAEAVADLADRLSAPLAFGTAGLRGPLRAGPAGMNLTVVRRAAYGIGSFLLGSGERDGVVVVGYDGRRRSAEFAADAAGVLAAQGFSVLLSSRAHPTPLTAFAVRELGAAAGLQVTASHNPPQDNGLKVYLRGGAQLISPLDTRIEQAIAAAPAARSIEVNETAGGPLVLGPVVTGSVRPWPDSIVDDYLARAATLARTGHTGTGVGVALTPMHGVGGEIAVKALHLAGFPTVHVVSEQAVPDGGFPTVPFPNPEEPGATDLLLALAARTDAAVAVALDPDADRCAIGVPTGGSWRMLTGDETGALLADHLLRHLDRTAHPDPLVATTIVSAELLRSIAAGYGARYDETLTGFKWIVRAGDGEGTGLVFGYEEALGLCVDPDRVRDKDGISAAVLACDLIAELAAAGRTIGDRLDELARTHGLFVTGPLSIRVADLSLIPQAMRRLRSSPPASLLDDPVTESTDLLPQTDGLRWRTDRVRVVVRPSGTEPKLKCYLQVHADVPAAADDATLAALRATATGDLDRLRAEVAQIVGL
ncbi:phospho-sugar mutase [Nakamurella sp.]|uniref:phospho-sugar mutase n=1 Tax=Nakamurella sp. TaxID=1869182 RepID=UPI003782E059